jgi:hypothetical protein
MSSDVPHNPIEAVLKYANDRDTLHRWIDEQPEDARILILSVVSEETKDVHKYCCSNNLSIHESNWILDVYKRYLMDSTENP